MAEAEFTGKEKKKLAAKSFRIAFTLANAVFARLAENLFMRDRPGNAGNGNGQHKQPDNLQRQGHLCTEYFSALQVALNGECQSLGNYNAGGGPCDSTTSPTAHNS